MEWLGASSHRAAVLRSEWKGGLPERNHRERKEQNRSPCMDEKLPAAAQVVEPHDT